MVKWLAGSMSQTVIWCTLDSRRKIFLILLQYSQQITCLTELHWLSMMACGVLKKK